MTARRVGEGWDPTRNPWAGVEETSDVLECRCCGEDYQPGRVPCACPPFDEWEPFR